MLFTQLRLDHIDYLLSDLRICWFLLWMLLLLSSTIYNLGAVAHVVILPVVSFLHAILSLL